VGDLVNKGPGSWRFSDMHNNRHRCGVTYVVIMMMDDVTTTVSEKKTTKIVLMDDNQVRSIENGVSQLLYAQQSATDSLLCGPLASSCSGVQEADSMPTATIKCSAMSRGHFPATSSAHDARTYSNVTNTRVSCRMAAFFPFAAMDFAMLLP